VAKKWERADIQNLDILQFATYSVEFHNLGPALLPLNWVPTFVAEDLIVAYAREYYEYLLYDDLLLGDTGVRGLEDEEVVVAAYERGIWLPNLSQRELRERLQQSVKASLKTGPLE